MLRGVTESQGSNLSILTGKTVTIGDPVRPGTRPGGADQRAARGRRGRPRGPHRRPAGRALLHRARERRGQHRRAHDGPAGRRARRGVPVRRRGGHVPDHRHGRHGHRQPGGPHGEDRAAGPPPGQAAAGAGTAGRLRGDRGLPALDRGVADRHADRGLLPVPGEGDPLPGRGQRGSGCGLLRPGRHPAGPAPHSAPPRSARRRSPRPLSAAGRAGSSRPSARPSAAAAQGPGDGAAERPARAVRQPAARRRWAASRGTSACSWTCTWR